MAADRPDATARAGDPPDLPNQEPPPRPRGASRGQVLVTVALMMTALIGMAALVTDTGLIWVNRRHLQNAVDAAALAGAQQLPNDAAGARSIACTYGTDPGYDNYVNGMIGKSGDCGGKADVAIGTKYVSNDKITVTAYKQVQPFFGRVVGWNGVEISADATAVVGSIAASCPFPIFQTPEMLPGGGAGTIEFYKLTAMHLSGSDSQSGNFLSVDVGSGANALLDAMVNNTCGQPVGPTAGTEPGGKIGKVVDGFQWRVYCAGGGGSKPNHTPACPSGPQMCPDADVTKYLVQNAGGDYDLDQDINRANCTRLVVVPIFPGPFSAYNGKTTVTIQGFALYYIAGVCDNSKCTHATLGELKKGDSWGYYVRMVGTAEQYMGYNGYGTKVVVLID